jgi:hypothetical protein
MGKTATSRMCHQQSLLIGHLLLLHAPATLCVSITIRLTYLSIQIDTDMQFSVDDRQSVVRSNISVDTYALQLQCA